MEAKVHIVTDSTAYLPEQWLQDNPHVHVVPLTVNCGGETMEDWVENNSRFKEALNRLSKRDAVPITSQPAPGRFLEVFRPLVEKGYEIVTITICSRLSGTAQSALNAASILGQDKITIVDSHTTAPGMRMLVEDAAAAALEGRSREEISVMVEQKKHNMEVFLVPPSLEYLHRGGRIGGAQALLGSLLNIKPVLYINDEGVVEVLDKVRTLKKALGRMAEVLPDNCSRASVGHFLAEDTVEILRELVEAKLGKEVMVQEMGPVIATHAGPGVTGLFFEIPG